MSKVYERTENGVTTNVDRRASLDEINAAMIGDTRRQVRQMSAGRTGADIEYKDGRKVRLVLVDATKEPTSAHVALIHRSRGGQPVYGRLVTVKNRQYVVADVIKARPHIPNVQFGVNETHVSYWSVRGGERFGATRVASPASKSGTVGALIWAQVAR